MDSFDRSDRRRGIPKEQRRLNRSKIRNECSENRPSLRHLVHDVDLTKSRARDSKLIFRAYLIFIVSVNRDIDSRFFTY